MASDSTAPAGQSDAGFASANSVTASSVSAPGLDVAVASEPLLDPASPNQSPATAKDQKEGPAQETSPAHTRTSTPPSNIQPTAATSASSSGPGQPPAPASASTSISTSSPKITDTPPASIAQIPTTAAEAIPSSTVAPPPPSLLNATEPADATCSSGPGNDGEEDMSNHSLLLGRPVAGAAGAGAGAASGTGAGAGTAPSSHPPSRPSSYGSGSPIQPASSTASPALRHQSLSHSSATPPPNQLSSYSIASNSHPPDAQRQAHINSSTTNGNANSVTLPSMRTIDALAHQSTATTFTPNTINGHPPPTGSTPGQPYYAQTAASTTPSSGPSSELSRYPIPHDPRLSSRASKKEIKRRTKTGCLTCRKRRIKCDETRPDCNNCKKSKRECLGYDPVFQPQPISSKPASSLQPALSPTASLNNNPSSSPISVAATAHQLNALATTQPSVPPYPSSSTSMALTTNSATNSAYNPTSSAPTSLPPSAPVKIEPHSYPTSSVTPVARSYQTSTAFDPARHIGHTANPPLDHRLPPPPKMKVFDIIDTFGHAPTPPRLSPRPEIISDVTKIYRDMYATTLSDFFETSWYKFSDKDIMSFLGRSPLFERLATFVKVLEAVRAKDETQMVYSGILEARIVWELACLVLETPERGNVAMRVQLPPEDDSAEARSRLLVVEALLNGECLSNNPLSPPVADTNDEKTKQFDFWYNLADFIRQRDSPESTQARQAREDVLGRMRRLLNGNENRDVLYSIAVARHLAPIYGPDHGETTQEEFDERDPLERLVVASKFIVDEAKCASGTTNVARRICDIALRAYIFPGTNIDRRA